MNANARTSLLATAFLAMTGCSTQQLRPAPEAQTVPGMDTAAVTERAGVRMTVQANAWTDEPGNLEQQLTPLRVTIANQGNQPVWVRYEDFALETGRGITYSPLPPLNIRGTVTQRADVPVYYPRYAITPRFVHRGFYIAPWYSPYYVGMRPWAYPWAFSPLYYETYYPRWTVELPTADMLELAIPEGVVEPGGTLSGFLYFPELADDLGRVRFKAELKGGRDGQRLAALELPFEAG